MKTKLIIVLFIGLFSMNANAQVGITPNVQEEETTKPKITPEKAAFNQANKAEKALGLTTEQKKQFESFSLTRITKVQPMREQMKGMTDKEEKRKLQQAVNAEFVGFNKNVESILTADQKTKWEAHKKEQKEKNAAKKEAKVPFED